MIAGLAGSAEASKAAFSRRTAIIALSLVVIITFILRIWYAGNLYQDDGLWFTAAQEMLRGKVLYAEVFFDKPPGLPLLYAALFKVFGPHILAIRLFTIAYVAAISLLLFFFGKRCYGERHGAIAALLFAVFSTTYVSGDMQSLNTELLMTPFYTAGAYLLMNVALSFGRPLRLALAGGLLAGIGFQINPKSALDLLFFGIVLISTGWQSDRLFYVVRRAFKAAVAALSGFVLASLPFLAYVADSGALARYTQYVWDWGSAYAGYYPVSRGLQIFLHYGTDYFLINNVLLVGLVVVVAFTMRRMLKVLSNKGKERSNHSPLIEENFGRTDAAILAWFCVSYIGVVAGGRFFAHYYFQVIPALCLLGARGILAIKNWMISRGIAIRAIACVLLVGSLSYTLIRCHVETTALAINWFRTGTSAQITETRRAATMISELSCVGANEIELGSDELKARVVQNPSQSESNNDYLFIWGNWPEVYYWSGLLPASGYLSAQPLTGIPADVWFGSEPTRSILEPQVTARAREELARDLRRTPPRYIVDELGFRDPNLSITKYVELSDIMRRYQKCFSIDGVQVYVRRGSHDAQ